MALREIQGGPRNTETMTPFSAKTPSCSPFHQTRQNLLPKSVIVVYRAMSVADLIL